MNSPADYVVEIKEKINLLEIQFSYEKKSLAKTLEILAEDKEKWEREKTELMLKIRKTQKEINKKENVLKNHKSEYETVTKKIDKLVKNNSQLEKEIQKEKKTLEEKKEAKNKSEEILQEQLEKTLEQLKAMTETNEFTKGQQNLDVSVVEETGQKRLSELMDSLTSELREKEKELEYNYKQLSAKVASTRQELWKLRDQVNVFQLECDDWVRKNEKLKQQIEIFNE